MAAAAEIEAQLDVFLQVVLQVADRPGQPDNAVYTNQNRQRDEDRPGPKIFLHDDLLNLACLLLAFCWDQVRDRAAGDLQFDVVRLYAQHQAVAVDGHNGSDDAAARQYHVSVLQLFEHLLLLLFLPLHGQKQKEIKDRKDEQDGNKAHQRVGGRLLQKQIQKHCDGTK